MEYAESTEEPIDGYKELYNTVYRDYQSLNIDSVINFYKSYPEAFIKVNAAPGISPEMLAKKLYNDTSYWDLILIINNKNYFTDLPRENDLVTVEVEELVKSYFLNSKKPYQGEIPEGLIEAYTEHLNELKQEENIKKQSFIVLNPNYKKQFLRSVKYNL